jgi:hypothetical protein
MSIKGNGSGCDLVKGCNLGAILKHVGSCCQNGAQYLTSNNFGIVELAFMLQHLMTMFEFSNN